MEPMAQAEKRKSALVEGKSQKQTIKKQKISQNGNSTPKSKLSKRPNADEDSDFGGFSDNEKKKTAVQSSKFAYTNGKGKNYTWCATMLYRRFHALTHSPLSGELRTRVWRRNFVHDTE